MKQKFQLKSFLKAISSKKFLYGLMIILLLVDTGYTYWQNQAKPLDGDMGWNCIPASDVQPVLDNPLGFKAILEDTNYVNPNRFFCHWFNQQYITHAPLFFQRAFSPIESVYVSMGFARTLTHLILAIILAMLVSKSFKFWKWEGILAMFITVCLFQTNGYNSQIGILDESTTYTFFYATPLIFLLIYLLPFIFQVYYKKLTHVPLLVKFLWIPLCLVVCLSGPLNPGIALVFALFSVIHVVFKTVKENENFSLFSLIKILKKIPKSYYFYLTPLVLFSLYSLILGKYNSLSIMNKIPLSDLYKKMWDGIVPVFFENYGYTILFLAIILNLILTKWVVQVSKKEKLIQLTFWVLAFSILYILLLPLGGYRDYRPYVIRHDTLLPVIYLLFYLFGVTTFFLLTNNIRFKKGYLLLVLSFIFFYTKSDNEEFHKNSCEKAALHTLSRTNEKVVVLKNDCAPIGWEKFKFPEESTLQAKLIHRWNITDTVVLFYNSMESDKTP